MKAIGYALLPVVLALMLSCGGTKEVVVSEPVSAATAQTAKGMPLYERGCYARALDYFYSANELFTAAGDSRGTAMSMNNIGVVYRAMGEAGAAIPFFADALRIYRTLGDREQVRQALSNLAAAEVDTGDYASAAKHVDEAMAIGIPGKPFPPAMTVKGILLARQGDAGGAETMLREALDDIGRRYPGGEASANYALGELLLVQARFKEAVPLFERALASDRKAGFYRGIADDLAALGRAMAGLKDDTAAVDAWEQSVRIYALLGMEEKVRSTMALLEEAAKRSNRDIALTRALVERWVKGQTTDSICE